MDNHHYWWLVLNQHIHAQNSGQNFLFWIHNFKGKILLIELVPFEFSSFPSSIIYTDNDGPYTFKESILSDIAFVAAPVELVLKDYMFG